MSETTDTASAMPTPHTLAERLELANQLYREYRSRCFWFSPRELVITEEMIPFVVKGLRNHGGHRGFRLAARLLPADDPANRRVSECR